MNKKTDNEADEFQKNIDKGSAKGPSELVIGLVTFVVFILFITAWMFLM